MFDKYKNGFVVGKFAPFHNGHKLVIDTALEHCEHVFVLSYTSQKFPKCSSFNRRLWLETHYREQINSGKIVIHVVDEVDMFMPNDDDPPADHRRYCKLMCWQHFTYDVHVVFGSETYIKELAPVINDECDYHIVDLNRMRNPISGTYLRKLATEDLVEFKKYVPAETYASFIPKILFIGGESTGKSTLTKRLTEEFPLIGVDEYGRDFYEAADGKLDFPDMLHIAETQLKHEYTAGATAMYYDSKLIVCDTSPLTTSFYSQQLFGCVDRKLNQLAHFTKTDYDQIFLCSNDFPMVQDGTRQDEEFRTKGQSFYKIFLSLHKVPYTELTGSIEERVNILKNSLKLN